VGSSPGPSIISGFCLSFFISTPALTPKRPRNFGFNGQRWGFTALAGEKGWLAPGIAPDNWIWIYGEGIGDLSERKRN